MSAHRRSGWGRLKAHSAGVLLACMSVLSFGGGVRADAEVVLVLVPQTPEPNVVELFHRVEAELRLHDFRPEVLVASPEDATDTLLAAEASAKRAFAAVAIAEQTPGATLQVWIVDGRTGLTRRYQVAQRAGEEAGNVVAVRAVDLLRANRSLSAAPAATGQDAQAAPQPQAQPQQPQPQTRTQPPQSKTPDAISPARSAGNARREHAPQPSSTPTTAAVHLPQPESSPSPDSTSVQEHASPPRAAASYGRAASLQLAAEAVALSLSRRIGWSFGPSVGAWLRLGERLRIGLVLVAPLWGAVLHTRFGNARISQQLAWLEVGALLLRAGPVQLSAAAGGGVHLLQAKGAAVPPLRSVQAPVRSWTASLAARVDVMLSARWSLGMTLRARAFAPAVEVAVSTEAARLALPAVEAALGLGAWL